MLKKWLRRWLGIEAAFTFTTAPLTSNETILESNSILVLYTEELISEALRKKWIAELKTILSEIGYKNEIIVLSGGLTCGTITNKGAINEHNTQGQD